MDDRFSFFVYLVESYARHKDIPTADAMKLFDDKGITDFVYDMYDLYHVEAIENAFADIDSLIETGKPAW